MEGFWSEKETDILRENYGKISVKDIREQYLPHRSEASIRGKAGRLLVSSALVPSINKSISKLSTANLLSELGRRGYASTKSDLPKMDETYEFPKLLEPTEIGIVSDTHLGSKCQQITHLNRFYDFCYDRGIKVMLNCGDIIEGNGKVYRGQEYDMFIHGATAQQEYAVKVYPKRRGMVTYIIGGNHDESFYKSDGNEIVRHISEKRDDILYLGMYGAHLKLGDIKIYMMHGAGGVAYARSYKLQKIIEQMAPQKKPHLLFCGHWHVATHLPMYRNVEGFSLGCFQSQTGYLRRKGLYPTNSGLVVKIHPDEGGLKGIDTHWEYYHVPVENDY